MKRICSALLAFCLAVSLCGMGAYAEGSQETEIALSDTGVTVNGAPASSDSASAVYVGADIVYYHDGTDASYGEGTEQEMHSAEEAAAHTVVTITQPGTYRVTGTLSLGQLAIDLGEDAAEDPEAVVTLILDNVDITCTVAPAVIFYNVYECGSADLETAQAVVDTTAAGANVILAEGSVNNVTGSHVARIYKEGTTKKLHKYDGAFYSKMSMNIGGEGTLNITADNEGLDTELHLTINGGVININSQDDGINTNEDGVSVTTINGGTVTIRGGLGSEGDGIDSNGFLVINGGTVWTTANERSGDGGVDADSDILLNGGNVYAFGSRNDAASSDSAQPYLELSFASTLPAGTQLTIADSEGNTVTELTLDRACQSVTLSQQDTPFVIGETYALYVNGVRQQYTGNSFGMMGGGRPGGMGGMEPPEGMELPEEMERPEGMEPPEGTERPDGMQPPEGMEIPEGGMLPEGMERPGGMGGGWSGESTGEASADFTLTETTHSFSGISDWTEESGKTAVTFSVNGGAGISDAPAGGTVTLTGVTASANGAAVELDPSHVQLTVTDQPSENYAATCLLSDGAEALSALMPTEDGTYQLTITVLSEDESYTGTSVWTFTIGGTGYDDVAEDAWYAQSVVEAVNSGLLTVSGNRFQPEADFTADLLSTELTVPEEGAISRRALVEALWQASGSPVSSQDLSAFADSQNEDADAVRWAVEQGILQGRTDGALDLDADLTRAEAAVILARWNGLN